MHSFIQRDIVDLEFLNFLTPQKREQVILTTNKWHWVASYSVYEYLIFAEPQYSQTLYDF